MRVFNVGIVKKIYGVKSVVVNLAQFAFRENEKFMDKEKVEKV